MIFVNKMFTALSMSILATTAMAAPDPSKVLTVGLGDQYYHSYKNNNLALVDKLYSDLQGKGIDISWVGCPPGWDEGIADNQNLQNYYQACANIARKYGIGAGLTLHSQSLLPYRNKETSWQGQTLDPKTGDRVIAKKWDLANPVAFAELTSRQEKFLKAMAPRELYVIDEVLLMGTGVNAHINRMSAYWTSPTYSDAALASFREFAKNNPQYQLPADVKFPVTTVEQPISQKYNAGLPAVAITEKNSSFLQEDNNYPDSNLWKAWCDWRSDLLTQKYAMQIKLANEIFSDNPNWRGTMISSPTFWFNAVSGLDAEKVAKIPGLTYLVAGYMNGRNIAKLIPYAKKNNILAGGMIELSVYGNEKGANQEPLLANFTNQINAGAKLMLFYPIANFDIEKKDNLSERKIGLDYRPEQVENWAKCVEILKSRNLAYPTVQYDNAK